VDRWPIKTQIRAYFRFARHSDSGDHWWIVLVGLQRHLSRTVHGIEIQGFGDFHQGTLLRQEPDATLQVSKARIGSERVELRFNGQLGYLRVPFR
jgi:hypothetical protein